MFQNRTSGFSKSADCPSSDRLLAFRQKRLGIFASDIIGRHVVACDFCAAELEFYRHFPTIPDEDVKPDRIPGPLYDLAQAILTNRTSGINALRTIVGKHGDED
ncbi:MAG: hypothetical protein J5I65_04045 [Aridibacter famidurans]|nr:hypothetical protein [Aridibacter famidurans]